MTAGNKLQPGKNTLTFTTTANLNKTHTKNDNIPVTVQYNKYKYKYNSYFYCAPYLTDGALQKSANTCFTAVGTLK